MNKVYDDIFKLILDMRPPESTYDLGQRTSGYRDAIEDLLREIKHYAADHPFLDDHSIECIFCNELFDKRTVPYVISGKCICQGCVNDSREERGSYPT